MFRLNEYGKIVVDNTEVYYGCITDYNEHEVKLFVVDWRDRFNEPKSFTELITPRGSFKIKYDNIGVTE